MSFRNYDLETEEALSDQERAEELERIKEELEKQLAAIRQRLEL